MDDLLELVAWGAAGYLVYKLATEGLAGGASQSTANPASQPVNSTSQMPAGNPGMISTHDLVASASASQPTITAADASWRAAAPLNATGGFGSGSVPQNYYAGNGIIAKAPPPVSGGASADPFASYFTGQDPTVYRPQDQTALMEASNAAFAATQQAAAQQAAQLEQQHAAAAAREHWVYCGPGCYTVYDVNTGAVISQIGSPGGSAAGYLSQIAASAP